MLFVACWLLAFLPRFSGSSTDVLPDADTWVTRAWETASGVEAPWVLRSGPCEPSCRVVSLATVSLEPGVWELRGWLRSDGDVSHGRLAADGKDADGRALWFGAHPAMASDSWTEQAVVFRLQRTTTVRVGPRLEGTSATLQLRDVSLKRVRRSPVHLVAQNAVLLAWIVWFAALFGELEERGRLRLLGLGLLAGGLALWPPSLVPPLGTAELAHGLGFVFAAMWLPVPWVLAGLALATEGLQVYAPGRSPSWVDLGLDGVGALVGLVLSRWFRSGASSIGARRAPPDSGASPP